MAWTRNRPTPEGRGQGDQMVRIYRKIMDGFAESFPELPQPCASCAFRGGTAPNGCPETLMTAIKCVLEREPFLCHVLEADGSKHACAGRAIVSASLPPDSSGVECPWDYPEAPPEGARPGDPS